MSRYKMEDGTIVDTQKSTVNWEEKRDHNGQNFISRATKDQWLHQELFRSRKGRYYIVHHSDWQGSIPHAEWMSPEEATRWLMLMQYALPEDLKKLEEIVSE